MKYHWSIVLVLVLATNLGIWFWRTKDMDFLTPKEITLPPEDMGHDLATGTPSFTPTHSRPEPVVIAQAETLQPELDDQPKAQTLDLGDPGLSPGLYEYINEAEKGVEHLFQLASAFQAKSRYQSALLAFERIIDSTEATPEEQIEAATGIAALTLNLPLWNVDPTSTFELSINLGSARKTTKLMKTHVLDLSDLVREHSGNQIDLAPIITGGKTQNNSGPIAIWISSLGQAPTSTSVSSINPETDDTEDFLNQLSLATYRLVRGRLATHGYSANPPPAGIEGKDLLTNYITRRMWYDFAQTLDQSHQPSLEAE